MLIYRLVLTDGTVLECGQPWPGPDGKPYRTKGPDGQEHDHPAHVWLIGFFPDNVDVDEEGQEQDPAHYKVLMRGNKGSYLEHQDETQIYKIYIDKVKYAGEVWNMKDAQDEFEDIMKEAIKRIDAAARANQQPRAAATASAQASTGG